MKWIIVPAFVVFLSTVVKSETGEAYHGPLQARELFSYDDRLFYFYSDRVPYEEAAAICQASDMHLTHLDNPGKAKFASESVSEAWMVFEDMWIGAKKHELGRWVWEWTHKKIPEESQIIGNYTYMYPPWVDNEVPTREGKDCLAMDRNGHNDPLFVDLDCKLPRPFICEQNIKQNKSDPWSSNVVEAYDIEFILYHGRLSWPAAVSFCRQQGYALATVENMTIARKLAKAMLKSRPEFEDAWIGANFKDDGWVWVETGEEVKAIPGEYKDPRKGETPGNTIVPQFPPWFEAEPKKGRDCVVFDRHLCDEPKFIDLKCNRQRDFICINRHEESKSEDTYQIVDRDKKRYIFFPVLATWNEAKRICDEEGESTTMLNLTDIEETKFIMQTMSDARRPIDHIWLGGKIIENQWYWVGRDMETDLKRIQMVPDETGFPPWCDNDTNLAMSCLNLDRQNHWTPLIYGLECNSTQAVVCVQPVEPNDRIVKYKGAGVQDPAVQLRVTKLKKNPLSWDQANLACTKEVGKLWRPRFDLSESAEAIAKIFEDLKEGQNKDNDVEVYHVNAGQYNSKKGAWVIGKQVVQIETGWKPEHGDCLVGQINKTATKWSWLPVKCYHKLYSQVICQPKCPLEEVPYEQENSAWICDAATSSIFDHKMKGMGCAHRCQDQKVTIGPEKYTCQQTRGWLSNQGELPVTASECKPPNHGLDLFKNIPKGTATLGFVIDSTSDSPRDYNASKYLIGNLIDYYRANLDELTVYVVSIEPDPDEGEETVIKVKDFKVDPFTACSEIKEKVLDVLIDRGDGIREFSAGIGKIREALGDTMLNEANIIFIVPETNQRGIFKEKARELNEEARVFAIGTNRHTPISQLVDLASKVHKRSLAIRFSKPSQVVDSVRALNTQVATLTCLFVAKDYAGCKCNTAFDEIVNNIPEVSPVINSLPGVVGNALPESTSENTKEQ